jgi:hypothetical protein
MLDAATTRPHLPEAIHPPAISLQELWPWTLFAAALLLLVYFVGIDEGATSVFGPGAMTLHEWVHDGRHLLGFPCH